MNKNVNNNAAERECYAGSIFDCGSLQKKAKTLQMIPQRELIENGFIYVHDMEGYGEVYNCCCPQIRKWFNRHRLKSRSEQGKIFEIFQLYQELIAEMALNQTGGIGFANFDQEISDLFEENHISENESNEQSLLDALSIFLRWINITKTRYNREPYYITLNVGLCVKFWGRSVTSSLLKIFASESYIRPNIVFKVNKVINSYKGTPNYELFLAALKCTASKMIPTYLLTDSIVNCKCKADELAIMGCRTRVYRNRNGKCTSRGRGNIAYVTINLPKIALMSSGIKEFYSNLDRILLYAVEILLHRKDCFLENDTKYMLSIFENGLWGEVASKDEMIRQGTFSVGFIGLEEASELLFFCKRYESDVARIEAENIIKYLSKKLDEYSEKEKLNFFFISNIG